MVGIGPGDPLDRTKRAEKAIGASSVVVGYTTYIELVEDLIGNRRVISTGMTGEVERCRKACEEAAAGELVSLISSGDPGIYGMAGLAIQIRHEMDEPSFEVEVVPGVTAASTAAARMGAPLMLDFASISLSDLLVSWDVIKKRLCAVARADMVCVLYNPRSKRRTENLKRAQDVFLNHRAPTTTVGIGTAVGREEERILVTTLQDMPLDKVDMRSTVIIGNDSSDNIDGLFVTPRGYTL